MDEDNKLQLITDKDKVPSGPHGWIQWKGTDVSMDVRCPCGELTHVDGSFCYFLQCGNCGARYYVGQHIALHPLNDEEAKFVETSTVGFTKSE